MKFSKLSNLLLEVTEKDIQKTIDSGIKPTQEDLSNAIKRVKEVRMIAFRQAPFMGEILRSLRFIFDAPGIDTAAVDPFGNIYFNSLFVKAMDQYELAFVVFHEASHITLQHLLRRGDHIPDISNIAEDAVINYLLIKEELTPPDIGVIPSADGNLYGLGNIKFDPPIQIEGKITEQVYYELLKRLPQSSGSGEHGFDEHLEQEKDGGVDENQLENIEKGKPVQPRHVKDPKTLDPTEQKELKKKWNEVNERAKQTKKARGATGSGDMIMGQMIIETEGQIDWRNALREFVTSISQKRRYDPKQLARRGYAAKAYLPRRRIAGAQYDMVIAVDVSGSIVNFYPAFIAEVLSLFAELDVSALFLWWDTEVKTPIHLDNENVEEVLNYIPTSGGTEISCVKDFLEQNELNPPNILYFTDGQVEPDPQLLKDNVHDLVILCPNGSKQPLEKVADEVVEMF